MGMDRHNLVDAQFKNLENEEKEKEKEKLDANKEKVKEIRDGLMGNNVNWRELIENVCNDYNAMIGEKQKLIVGVNDTSNGLKDLLDLICKIPKRKILEQENEENKENEENVENEENEENEENKDNEDDKDNEDNEENDNDDDEEQEEQQ